MMTGGVMQKKYYANARDFKLADHAKHVPQVPDQFIYLFIFILWFFFWGGGQAALVRVKRINFF